MTKSKLLYWLSILGLRARISCVTSLDVVPFSGELSALEMAIILASCSCKCFENLASVHTNWYHSLVYEGLAQTLSASIVVRSARTVPFPHILLQHKFIFLKQNDRVLMNKQEHLVMRP